MKASEGAVVGEIIRQLSELEPDARQRTLAAAQAFFGVAHSPTVATQISCSDVSATDELAVPLKAATWMRQNALTREEVEKVFHISENSAEIIAPTIPGRSKKEQTFNCYKLLGVSKLLANGSTDFDDKEARELCESQGCYDAPNHATNFRNKGNDLAGSKEKGWTLTSPGLKSAGALVKELAANS